VALVDSQGHSWVLFAPVCSAVGDMARSRVLPALDVMRRLRRSGTSATGAKFLIQNRLIEFAGFRFSTAVKILIMKVLL